VSREHAAGRLPAVLAGHLPDGARWTVCGRKRSLAQPPTMIVAVRGTPCPASTSQGSATV
jgi:hypothetical protein